MKKEPVSPKQKEILRTAVRLFRKEGFYNVSVEDIVRASNSSTAAFYGYFSAKEELAVLYRNDMLSRCLLHYRKLNEDAEYAELDAAQKLRELLLYVMQLHNKVGADCSRVFTHYRIRERNAEPEDKPYLEPTLELLLLGQQQGCIRSDISAEQLCSDTDHMLEGAYLRWQLHQASFAMDEVCAGTLELFCNRLGPSYSVSQSQRPLREVWETALYMLIPDPRSGIKQIEDDWLGRFTKNK